MFTEARARNRATLNNILFSHIPNLLSGIRERYEEQILSPNQSHHNILHPFRCLLLAQPLQHPSFVLILDVPVLVNFIYDGTVVEWKRGWVPQRGDEGGRDPIPEAVRLYQLMLDILPSD